MKTQEMLRIVGWVVIGLGVVVGVGTALLSAAPRPGNGELLGALIGGAILIGGLAIGAPFLALADLLDKTDRQTAAIESLHRTIALQGGFTVPGNDS